MVANIWATRSGAAAKDFRALVFSAWDIQCNQLGLPVEFNYLMPGYVYRQPDAWSGGVVAPSQELFRHWNAPVAGRTVQHNQAMMPGHFSVVMDLNREK